jgi:hypothetical protein
LGDEPLAYQLHGLAQTLGKEKGILPFPASAGTGQETKAKMTVASDFYLLKSTHGLRGSSDLT